MSLSKDRADDVDCPRCKGSGEVNGHDCQTCNGSCRVFQQGIVLFTFDESGNVMVVGYALKPGEERCEECGGPGCPPCGHSGVAGSPA